ncbi:major facilitator superfamily domain-containing protein [Ditylenchus destructor]|uniref:Major facilitator superfamily domain-containing protein n=1 Tax=Ditylenchus destructor TaxID=166010 RepID=A0AAD4NCJ1_9BILA|nr:major facilitator superfamily domain-containing protein [Ditylenchus destructor]
MSANNIEAASTHIKKCSLWSVTNLRLRIAVALALALAIEGLMRSNINMAMVCMVNKTAIDERERNLSTSLPMAVNTSMDAEMDFLGENSTFLDESLSSAPTFPSTITLPAPDSASQCGGSLAKNESTSKGGELVITKQVQGWIFTSFYVGQLAIVMPGSYLCDRFGARNLVFAGAVVNVIGSFGTPFVARTLGGIALIILRFIMGCGQGVLVPCMNVLVTHWFPMSEKSTAIAIATTGNQISVIVAMLLTAELCQFQWLGGWASAFYSYGFIGVGLCAIWFWCVYDTPEEARNITDKEISYIHNGESKAARKIDPNEVPWSKIMSSLVVWSIALCSFSQNFMNVGIVVYLPSYYHRFLKLDITQNGLMSALPFIFQLVTKIVFAGIADSLKVRRIMSHSGVAKLFNLIASIGFSSGFIPGYNTSIVCIAPRYTASVASFSRLLGNIASVASPYMIGFFGDREEWKLAFWVIAFVSISTGILFQLCGSASVQSWATNIPATLNRPESQKEDTIAFLTGNSSTTP